MCSDLGEKINAYQTSKEAQTQNVVRTGRRSSISSFSSTLYTPGQLVCQGARRLPLHTSVKEPSLSPRDSLLPYRTALPLGWSHSGRPATRPGPAMNLSAPWATRRSPWREYRGALARRPAEDKARPGSCAGLGTRGGPRPPPDRGGHEAGVKGGRGGPEDALPGPSPESRPTRGSHQTLARSSLPRRRSASRARAERSTRRRARTSPPP